ncbi:hypothetical protein Nepgr_016598 [Nepenthes gracilis]|uniref:H(+)-exporting diphosphatase n=1 Tax=Nepenthes gracilis TaxID=150966 RepID=A0AAD3XRG3_NEPGR|nr:hypothetical protein Nepgr_016598 [Nepenthes gracilis]
MFRIKNEGLGLAAIEANRVSPNESPVFAIILGGIYPKAAAIGADDVNHFIRNILKDDLRNPVFIADKVGDNVRCIASNRGSYATPSSAALLVASISSIGVSYALTTLMYTPLANFVDTLVRLLTTLFATDFCAINHQINQQQ